MLRFVACMLIGLLAMVVAINVESYSRGKNDGLEVITMKNTKLTYHLQVAVGVNGSCIITKSDFGQIHKDAEYETIMFMKSQAHSHDVEDEQLQQSFGKLYDFFGPSKSQVYSFAHSHLPPLCRLSSPPPSTPSSPSSTMDEIHLLIDSGPPSNRIDLVFMGDGYTSSQRQLFFHDMQRLIVDMFESTTFASHTPLFNVWALFRPSSVSGIGVGGKPLNTAFGLYRSGTELRGVYVSKPQIARSACAEVGKDACDYPTLIGNDDYYGGLGGEFTISTRSPTSGTIVLRHEFGHNLVNVGEEYDGGQVYSGVNSARTLNVGWKHWLSDQISPLQAQQSRLAVQEHAWYLLDKAPYQIKFTTDGTYTRWLLTYSISGAPNPGDVKIFLDDHPVEYKSENTKDRTFNYLYSDHGLSKGTHTLRFESGHKKTRELNADQIQLQLCNYEITEFRNESLYTFNPSFIGAYNTYRLGGGFVGYRPDHETCLMRNMSSPDFCVVCTEGMWLNLLSRMSLIDNVTVSYEGGEVGVRVNAVLLGQLRRGGAREGERYEVVWRKEGKEVGELNGKFEWRAVASEMRGRWQVDLKYVTTEVRNDPRGYLSAVEQFSI
eukprot:TRINITY_DN1324_c0_g3_i1.p1 TRINITY_DN1324_c0_g3~~TRINITY_DN1324_c0_g3_i1.p1  ORF type:complete len:605 (-),score=137.64 TRINITY_DN1324_c0_g3_i1:201-2015(-)